MKSKKFYKRQFLNTKVGIAAVEATCELYSGGGAADGILKITDCNRAVQLELNWYEEEGKKNVKYKLDKLIAVAEATRAFLFPEEEKK